MRFHPTGRVRRAAVAFTLLELLVVIAVIGILAALLLPVLSQAKSRAQNIECLSNLRQLELSCHLYSADFDDFLVPNQVGGFVTAPAPTPTNGVISANTNTYAVSNPNSWCPGLAPYDTTPQDIQNGLLYSYNRSPAIYHCPSDISTVVGYPNLLRTRSYCMDISLNCQDAANTYIKYPEILQPPPNDLFVFIDTHEEDIFDATFGIFGPDSPWADYWLDLPADRHSQGANLSFADGHVEHWKWKAPKIFVGVWYPAYSEADLEDLHRLQQHVKPDVD
ncbi:MAG: prepilin-type N-terminal cleavage/methylation domain-containing protein [Limisphaerales bacterium]